MNLINSKKISEIKQITFSNYILKQLYMKNITDTPLTEKTIDLTKKIDVDTSLPKDKPEYILLTSKKILSIMPSRKSDSHKYDYGHTLCIGSSSGLTGAIDLSSLAALKIGAGLVTKSVLSSLSCFYLKRLEIMDLILDDCGLGYLSESNLEEISSYVEKVSSIVIGPGMGRSSTTKKFVYSLLKISTKPIVIDADGLNILSEIHEEEPEFLKTMSFPIILTPHIGEMSRLTGLDPRYIKTNRLKVVKKFSKKWSVIVLLKGPNTLIATPDGKVFINTTGNAGMATAGSGDVLAGMIGGLYNQTQSLTDAALIATYIHGLSGDLAKKELTEFCLTASDIISYIPNAIRKLVN